MHENDKPMPAAASPSVSGKPTVRVFDGDIDALYQLIDESWNRDYQDEMRFDYSRAFLRWNLESSLCDPDLFIGSYVGSKLVGFCARFPRIVSVAGKKAQLALGTFLTTHSDYRGRGIAKDVVTASVKTMKEKGYSGYFYYLQTGHGSVPLYDGLPIPSMLVLPKVRFYVKVLDVEAIRRCWDIGWFERLFLTAMKGIPSVNTRHGTICGYTPQNLSACTEFLNGISSLVPVARQWSSAELGFRLEDFDESFCYIYQAEGKIKGMMSGYMLDVRGRKWGRAVARSNETDQKAAFIDNIRLDPLGESEKRALIHHTLHEAKKSGCTLAMIPSSYSYDRLSLLCCGFVPDPFTPPVGLYFTPLNEYSEDLHNRRIYLDFM